MAFVHDKVWDLLRQTQGAMRDVGKFYGGGHPDRTRLQRPQVDFRVGRALIPGPGVESRPVFGADAHDALKDLVAPSPAKRFSRWRGGPERAEQEAHDNHAVRQSALIDSVRMVAELSESRSYANADPASEGVEYGALQEAVGGAWTAAHFDRVVERLEGFGHLPPGTAEQVALGWNEAGRQQILDRVHPQAPSGYAFAEEVGKQAGMSAERTLHWLNNAPPHVAPGVAADLLMRGSDALQTLAEQNPVEYARFKSDVAENIRENFEELNHTLDTHEARTVGVDHATQASNGGRRIADAALELIAAKEAELTPAAEQPSIARNTAVEFDPRSGTADPSRPAADPPHSPTDRTGRSARSAGVANAVSPRVGE
ncbi:hypothetical protein [Kribbella sp. C-35]|uniref:hypothetical protein n=1 Tax=Kribbella sp. C-35 TaxID=2789276 RepID=UPI00397A8C64